MRVQPRRASRPQGGSSNPTSARIVFAPSPPCPRRVLLVIMDPSFPPDGPGVHFLPGHFAEDSPERHAFVSRLPAPTAHEFTSFSIVRPWFVTSRANTR